MWGGFISQEQKDIATLNTYLQRFHVNYPDIDMAGNYYLTEREKWHQNDYSVKLRGKPADPDFMQRDLFEKIDKWDEGERREISLSGGYGGTGAVPASKWEEQRKKYDAEKQRAHELCKKYREEIYPKELKAFEDEFNAIERKRRQTQLYSVRYEDTMMSYFQNRREKEKLRQQLEDPEWERLQLELERKKLAIRRQAEEEAEEIYNQQFQSSKKN